jgi:EAL domain-containing protein (putative c-di-GMP-specific phosphodiesterase class I)
MYLAKDRGRNRLELFSVDMRERALARLETENDLRHGIDRGELRLHYQPYVDLTDPGRVVGAEALVRWNHPERGMVSPAEFIDLAEETGLVHAIGHWVLHETCQQLRNLKDVPGAPRYISINVSPHQLTDDRFVRAVARALTEWDLEPDRLCLEITETALIDDTDAALSILNQLKALGVRLALDDFGTGYSALSYLRMLPVDIVKIDRSFVTRLSDSSRDRAIVRGIIDLAHALGLAVVAEGVEHPSEAAQLRLLGCDLGQGYLFARPAETLARPAVEVVGA